ncbi:facilitated trehalose transporter Tret1-like isoform X1 [Palaemon carinicauda]|uniref:facilitated trehalose transporter Tret1-like isoform X1 n=1 Tax=Palaemon carinicauda TaxID=392227 RepID=UPI0035B6128B
MADNEDDGEWSPWEKEEAVAKEEEEEEPRVSEHEENQPLIPSSSYLVEVCEENLMMDGSDTIRLVGPKPSLLPQYLTAAIVTLGSFSMGCVLGYSSPAGPLLLANSTDGQPFLTEDQNNWFGSSLSLGAMIGGPVCGIGLTTIGRKGTMQVSAIPFVAGWILIAFATNFAMLMAGRIITGFCCGVSSMVITTYIGEFASPSIRGVLGSSFQLMVTLGLLYAMAIGAFVSSWQVLAGVCAIPPVIYFALLFFIKESPVYLLTKGKDDKAAAALQYFRGSDCNIQLELDMMRESIAESKRNKASFRDLLKPQNMKPLLIAIALMFFQQFSGINPVLFNLSIIFQDAGSSLKAAYSSIIISVVQVLATLFAVIVMDKAGRKLLLVASSSVMALSLVVLGEFFYEKMVDESWAVETLGWLPLVALIMFILAFSYGYGPVPWLMLGELFASDVKELAASITTLCNWTLSFIVTIIFLPVKNVIGDYGIYWVFSGICVLNLIFCVCVVPETKGKTLEEINAYFGAQPTDRSNSRTRNRSEM